jgi:uncharacterized membrane protein YczE
VKAVSSAHVAPPRVRGNIVVRSAVLGAGLAVFATGIVSINESKLGLSPWDVLNQGVAKHTPLSFGMANIAIAVTILILARRLDVRVRVGTVANALLVGTFVDLLLRLGTVQDLAHDSLAVRIVLLVAGILVIGFGTGLYISADMGAGPRDSLMLGITRRVRSRVGVVRTGLEVSATVVGFALGGTVGIGTLAFALGIGPAVELSFALLAHPAFAQRAELEPLLAVPARL